jgi:hypothetical protein
MNQKVLIPMNQSVLIRVGAKPPSAKIYDIIDIEK